jgi:hypothetical protein
MKGTRLCYEGNSWEKEDESLARNQSSKFVEVLKLRKGREGRMK